MGIPNQENRLKLKLIPAESEEEEENFYSSEDYKNTPADSMR